MRAEAPEYMNVVSLTSENICIETQKPYQSEAAITSTYSLNKDQEIASWLSFLAISPKLHSLAKCESGLNFKAIGDIDLDEPAYGLFQYRKSTYLTYSRKYNIYPTSFTDKQIKDDVYNVENQIKLTGLILQEPNGYRNWLNCSKKIELK